MPEPPSYDPDFLDLAPKDDKEEDNSSLSPEEVYAEIADYVETTRNLLQAKHHGELLPFLFQGNHELAAAGAGRNHYPSSGFDLFRHKTEVRRT
jgi:hypothetical protein